MTTLKNRIKEGSRKVFPEMRAWRRHLHMYPELAFQEFESARFIAERLTEMGINYREGIAKTGIVAIIEGKDPATRVVALRADMDALPIEEKNEVPYRSQNKGVMHACGHDAHTASLLGAAKILKECAEEWTGTVKLIFQPSEEKLPGGASVMIREGVLKNPEVARIWGQHVHPPLVAGKVGMRAGPYMASADEIYLTIKGKGGHAALPQNVIDPVLISAHILLALQQIVSRKSNPLTPSVLSFGKLMAEGATNVIPDRVFLEGTFRTFDEEWRFEAHQWIEKIARDTARAMGGDCEVDIRVGYPYVHNDEALTKKSRQLAEELLGAENVVDLPQRMTGEDFAFYGREIPACFYRLGTGNPEKNILSPIHSATFDIDEEALITGAALEAWLAAAG